MMQAVEPEAGLTGGCQCGAIRYEITVEPSALYVCHCRECRKQSGSAFGLSLVVPRAGLRLTQGAPKRWSRPADSGRRLACFFCADCGSRVWHEPEALPGSCTVKAGSLDQPVDLAPAIHIWTAHKLPGVVIPAGAEQIAYEPE